MNAPITGVLQSTPAMAESLQVAETLSRLAAATLSADNVDGAIFVNLPPGYTHKDVTDLVERAQHAPRRKHGSVTFKAVDSLVAYCIDQCCALVGYIYADPDARTMTAVFNDHRTVQGWRDHRATFKAEYTPEFQRWMDNNGSTKAKGQSDFAEFIEDNLADITEPAAQQLLDVATTISMSNGINFSSSKRLQDGQTQLMYVEALEATAGADGGLTIPKEFTLGLRIFKNGGGYLLKARLKYRLNSGQVKFWYELDRPERAVEDAFKGYIDQVREKSGYTVLIGAAG